MSSQRSDRGGNQQQERDERGRFTDEQDQSSSGGRASSADNRSSNTDRPRDEQGRFTDEDVDVSRSSGRGSSSPTERSGRSEPDSSRDRSDRDR